MAKRSRGRGTAAAFGFLLLIAGLIGAGVLYVLSLQRPDKAVEGFARAGAGCTTTLDFTETGTFFVYAETAGDFVVPDGGCEPTPTAGERFSFEITGPATVSPVSDVTVAYDRGDFEGDSIARFEIATPGLYEIAVRSEDIATIAAVGRDPDSGVDEQQRNALIVGATGGLLGLLLLVLAGLRSKKATAPVVPDAPSSGPRPLGEPPAQWPPAAPEVARRPINPQQPDRPVEATPPPPPLPARVPGAGVPLSPWGAPTSAQPVSSEAPMPPPPPVRTPQPIPVLPDAPVSVSGEWPPTPLAPPPTPSPPTPPRGSSPPPPPPPRR